MITLIIVICLITSILYIFNKEITLQEFLIMNLCTMVVVGICFIFTQLPIQNDTYFQSGRLITTYYEPEFVERYLQTHVVTYSCGKSTCIRTYTTTEYQKHKQGWYTKDSLGQKIGIRKSQYDEMVKDFGGECIVHRDRRRFSHGGTRVKGDSNTYEYENVHNTYTYPTTKLESWYNPVKKSNSLFKGKPTGKNMDIPYPARNNYRENTRLLAWTDFDGTEFDRFNTKLYEAKQCNVILLEAWNLDVIRQAKEKWNTGKKNDIIIAYTGKYTNPDTVRVFGWYKSEILSNELQTYILENGIKKDNLDDIYSIIVKYYEPFDFSQFNYLTKPVQWWHILITLIITLIVWGFLYGDFTTNYDRRY